MKKYTALILTLSLVLGGMNVFAEAKYKSSDWATEELEKAATDGIIPKELENEDLTENINRADFAKILVNAYEKIALSELVEVTESPFTDTDDTDVLKASNAGFILGMGEGLFMPEELLSREQAALMMTRVYKKVTYPDKPSEEYDSINLTFNNELSFADDEDISNWAEQAVYFMADIEIVNGVGENKFAPKDNISREQAIITAYRFKEKIMKEITEDPDPYKNTERGDAPVAEKGENDYTVAFIGGSLTAGGSLWINATRDYLQEKMPDKNVVTINAGKGGTTSDFGAARFSEDVAQYNPDLVFIEFAVNDRGALKNDNAKIYMESMIYQCKQLENEPVVIFLYAPSPVDKDSSEYEQWEAGVEIKEGLAKHYGIKSINVYDYMYNEYEATKEQEGYETFDNYLETLYQRSGSGFNVHGGYPKYAEAIVKELKEDYEGCMSPMKNTSVFCTSAKNIVEARYNQVTVNDTAMHYAGPWKKYNAQNKFETTDSLITIGNGHYTYPFFTDGVAQIQNAKGAFGIETKAEAISLNFIAATAGSGATVYIDGKKSGTVTCQSPYHGVNYNTEWIKMPNDGKTHSIIFIVDDPTGSNYVFRFGSIMERFMR